MITNFFLNFCRSFAIDQREKANAIIDAFLIKAKYYLTSNNFKVIPVNGFTKRKKKDQHIATFTPSEGYVNDLASLQRNGDFSLYEDNEIHYLIGKLKFANSNVSCNAI